jgi:heme/copper-type cytochrome/quinol oxidase subunit 3
MPARSRSLFVATAMLSAAMLSFFGGLVAIYIRVRDQAGGHTKDWVPKKVVIPEVAANTMLFVMLGAVILAQWSVYSAKRANRRDTAIGLALLGMFGFALLNAQSYIYRAMKLPVKSAEGSAFNTMFFTVTGAFFVAVIIGMVIAFVCSFRAIGGRYRAADTEAISAAALYWYVLAAAFVAVWFFVYVGK